MCTAKMHYVTISLVVLSSVLFQAHGFSLYDSKTSYAQFQPWPNGDDRIRLSLRFKTYAKTGLLLYVDDEGYAQYLTVALRGGFLVAELSEGDGIFESSSKTRVNDLQWHSILLDLTTGRAVYKVDDSIVAEHNLTSFALKSHMYVGGLPKAMDILAVTNMHVLAEERFLGCVLDVRYGNGSTDSPASLAQSSGTGAECKDACKPQNPCRNRGVCVNRFAKAECLCTGTGYRGEICQQELPVVGIPSPYDRVIIDAPSDIISSPEDTSLLIRFRSADSDGVIFYTAYKGDYILVELANGKVATSINLGSGSVTIASENSGYDDNRWHTIKLKRIKRALNLTVDSSDSSNGQTQGKFSRFTLPDSETTFFLGGIADSQLKLKSVSRRNFTGCLQELIFNDYPLFAKLRAKADGIRARDAIVSTCPEVKAASTTPVFMKSSSSVGMTSSGTVTTSTSIVSSFSVSAIPVTVSTNNPRVLCGDKINMSCNTSGSAPTSKPNVVSRPRFEAPEISPCPSNTISCGLPSARLSTAASPPRLPDSHSQGIEPNLDSTNFSTTAVTDRPYATEAVIVASKNERKEKDLTLWFIVAAGIAIVAFILAIVIIVKVNSANRKKYAMKLNSRRKSPVSDGGSFLKSSSKRKDSV